MKRKLSDHVTTFIGYVYAVILAATAILVPIALLAWAFQTIFNFMR